MDKEKVIISFDYYKNNKNKKNIFDFKSEKIYYVNVLSKSCNL